ncbi:MAG TPA: type II CAAX prenyl endopeptidase Rce1 family protein [Xenococcaceae cyanobacterium]|jgi:predicted Abi (CAAX) family protease
MLPTVVQKLSDRLIKAISTLPDQKALIYCLVLLIIYAVIVLSLGFKQKFIELEIVTNWQKILKISLTSLVAPAILEELFFRGLIVPHPSEKANLITLSGCIILSLLLFGIYHPLNAYWFFPVARQTFYNPLFLFFALLLGIICTISYLQSGSLWTAIIMHWLIVIIWLLVLGGIKQLHF